MRSPLVIAAGLVVVCACALATRPAQACSPGPCPEARLLPEDGATLAQNVPGFPFRPGRAKGSGSELERVALKDGAGREVPTTSKPMQGASAYDRLIVPDEPLAPGVYSLELTNPCGEPEKERRSFTVVDARPFPSEIGTLRAVRSQKGTVTIAAPARCVDTLAADAVVIEIEPTPSFAGFRGVAIYSVSVDGNPWVGPVTRYRGTGWPSTFDPFTVYATCAGSRGDTRSGVAPGKHVVEVRAHLEGAPSDPAPARMVIDLRCPAR